MTEQDPREDRSSEGQQDREAGGQVSEVSGMGDHPEPIQPGDATAGSEDADVQEGTAGPDAPPQHGRPDEKGEQTTTER